MTIFRLTHLAGMALLAVVVAAGTAKADELMMITSGGLIANVALTVSSNPILVTGSYTNANFNGWALSSITADVFFTANPYFSTTGFATCMAAPCTTDPLTVAVSGNGFTTAVDLFTQFAGQTINSGPVSGLTRTLLISWDPSNMLFATTSSLPEVTLVCSSSQCTQFGPNGGTPVGPSPYSTTETNAFTVSSVGDGFTFTSVSATSPAVPEPVSLLLVGIGLAATAGAYRRRKSVRVPNKAGDA